MHGQRTGLYGGHVYAQSEAIAGIAGNVAQRSDAVIPTELQLYGIVEHVEPVRTVLFETQMGW